jgi:hypothetical protein
MCRLFLAGEPRLRISARYTLDLGAGGTSENGRCVGIALTVTADAGRLVSGSRDNVSVRCAKIY